MMKRLILLAVIAIAAVYAYLHWQGSDDSNAGIGGDRLKVGFVYLTNPGDHGWTYAHEVGRQYLQDHFGERIETSYVENVPEGPDATRVIRELVAQDNKVIFTTSFGYMDQTLEVANENPDIFFDHITGYKRTPNMATGNIRFHEGRYVQGVAAGLITKTGTIGYIVSFPIPEVIMGINAFARGLRSVNPGAVVKVVWVNTWYDPVKEADAAKVLIAEGADVLTQHTDSPAMLQTAEENGVHGFGQGSDMEAFAPKAQLFASVNNWGPYYVSQVQKVLDGTWSTGDGPDHWAGNTWKGLADGYLTISEIKNMPASDADKVRAVADDLAAGKIDIFAGPMRDNNGNLVLTAGQVLDDGGLWGMDYYVEGVEGSIPN